MYNLEEYSQAGVEPSDHFTGVSKTIVMPKGASREVDDVMLARYASYMVAQNVEA